MKEHKALVASLAGAALIAARLLAISRFDVNTAATILQVSGVGTAVAGTALTLLPFALVVSTCAVAIILFLDDSLFQLPAPAGLAFSILATATVCLAAPSLVLGTAVFVCIAIGLGRSMRKRGYQVRIRAQLSESRLLRSEATALVILIVMTPIVLQRPWLPIQTLKLVTGDAIVGYVLGESDGRIVIMSDTDRTIAFVNPKNVRSSNICSGPPRTGGLAAKVPQVTLGGSVLGLLLWGNRVPTYPACPTTIKR